MREIFKCDDKAIYNLPTVKTEGIKILLRSGKTISDDRVSPVYEGNAAIQYPFAASELHGASVVDGRALCSQQEGFKAVYELSLDIANSTIVNNFEPGDTIGILPRNNAEEVKFILERVELLSEADAPYVIENIVQTKSQIPKHIPVQATLRYTLKHCVELRAVLKKVFIKVLSTYCSENEEKKCLEFMASKEGSQLYTEHILNRKICLLDILKEFPSCKPSIACILAHLPRLLPRPYSIVNSRLEDGNTVKICFSVCKLSNGRNGLTTEWLERIVKGQQKGNGSIVQEFEKLNVNGGSVNNVPIYLRKNLGFSFPNEYSNVLMIGPGTGVGPYLGFLEKIKRLKKQTPSLKLGETWLFYGCRDENVDHIYKDELNGYIDDGILTKLSIAVSRAGNTEVKYVQDLIKQESESVAKFLVEGANVFVCGDLSVMAKQVEAEVVDCIEHTGRTHKESVEFVKQLQKDRKYLVDVWS